MKKRFPALLKNNIYLIAFLGLGLVAFLFHQKADDKEPPPTFAISELKSADTFIPRGYVLVPIEIANAESLSSLVGDVGGVVDLYLATTEQKKGGQKVGVRLKLLRAPLNPDQYAVLVKDSESSRILQYAGPFVAVIQNPEADGAQVSANAPARVKIDYQN